MKKENKGRYRLHYRREDKYYTRRYKKLNEIWKSAMLLMINSNQEIHDIVIWDDRRKRDIAIFEWCRKDGMKKEGKK